MLNLFKKKETHIDFMRQRNFGFALSALLLIISVVSLWKQGLNYGIEFTGGISIKAVSEQAVDVGDVRNKLSFLPGVSIQTTGENGTAVVIKSRIPDGEDMNQLVEKVKTALGSQYQFGQDDDKGSVRTVGPAIGKELKETSLLASIFALLAISVYIWFRFEWPFAIGCLLALAHDMLIVVGAFALFQWEFDMIVVAGLLSLAGYDCNDSIVTYDRIRENLRKFRKMPIDDILNRSINETLSRTILTSVTTLFVVVILLFVGGDTLRGFSITMTLGVILGTYSSICIAVPLLRYFDVRTVGETAETPKQ